MASDKQSSSSQRQRTSGTAMRTLKRGYYRFLRIRGAPEQIGLGFALGVFIGMTPFLGFHTVMAVMLAALLKWSKIAAGIGVFVTNPITVPIIYPLTYKLGASVAGLSNLKELPKLFEPGGVIALMKNSPLILVDLVVGGIIIGVPLAVIAYYFAYYTVTSARRRMESRKLRRMSRQDALEKRNTRMAFKRAQKQKSTRNKKNKE